MSTPGRPALALYFSPGGACSTASHLALEESGLAYEERPTLIARGEHRTPAYLRINPRGKVPALQVGYEVLLETTAILAWVAQQVPERGLWPVDALDQAQAIAMMSWYASTVHPAYAHAKRPDRFAEDPASQAQVQARGKAMFWDTLQQIEAGLQGRDWVMGSRFTVVDCYALILYGWGLRAGLPMGSLPAFSAWKDRMLERPAIRSVLERERHVLVEPPDSLAP